MSFAKQHVLPCGECPWRRGSIRGWLGMEAGQLTLPTLWLSRALGEVFVQCHCRAGLQCAGIAIFRANICKLPRYPEILRLEPDRSLVFATLGEFMKHHTPTFGTAPITKNQKHKGK